ncbi:MAG: dihydropteroate synthase [Planctomycetota bacterium]|nr:dihydropteroate synthase [Planctomycetota bacterium]
MTLKPIHPFTLHCGARTIECKRPLLMGILNVTPDSFSDGGHFLAAEKAIAHAKVMIDDGADIIDIGGESTRPGAEIVSVEDELRRVIPVIEGLANLDVTLSIDTQKAAVAEAATKAGAHIVNDVTGARDPDMLAVVAASQAALVLMHTRGPSSDMMKRTEYKDVVSEVAAYLKERAEQAVAAGIKTVILDPGVGFAKTAAQNFTLVRRLPEFIELGYPILMGPSRKSFIGHITGQPAAERIEGTIATVVASVLQGTHIVRVHDVKEVKRALLVSEAMQNG